jgi:hypothetical protein
MKDAFSRYSARGPKRAFSLFKEGAALFKKPLAVF